MRLDVQLATVTQLPGVGALVELAHHSDVALGDEFLYWLKPSVRVGAFCGGLATVLAAAAVPT